MIVSDLKTTRNEGYLLSPALCNHADPEHTRSGYRPWAINLTGSGMQREGCRHHSPNPRLSDSHINTAVGNTTSLEESSSKAQQHSLPPRQSEANLRVKQTHRDPHCS
ncbi:hypothetical protein AAFF_G00110680 [Aldrovandia affinis]|uniref:Uncharacterized protein n=1 Tax=Aldrovandia affinis TaxID=143900 RepID=A0AAD7RTE3_9TELE|nr:hypothetical protein AAFF_G00110680 [Aldrovandia affinis]